MVRTTAAAAVLITSFISTSLKCGVCQPLDVLTPVATVIAKGTTVKFKKGPVGVKWGQYLNERGRQLRRPVLLGGEYVTKVGLIAVFGGALLAAIGFKIVGPVLTILGTLLLLAYAVMRAGEIE